MTAFHAAPPAAPTYAKHDRQVLADRGVLWSESGRAALEAGHTCKHCWVASWGASCLWLGPGRRWQAAVAAGDIRTRRGRQNALLAAAAAALHEQVPRSLPEPPARAMQKAVTPRSCTPPPGGTGGASPALSALSASLGGPAPAADDDMRRLQRKAQGWKASEARHSTSAAAGRSPISGMDFACTALDR